MRWGGARVTTLAVALLATALPPAALARDVIVADLDLPDGRGTVLRVAPDGATKVLATGGDFVDPEGLVVTPQCEVYISDAGRGAILATDIEAAPLRTLASGAPLSHPVGMALTAGGALLVADEVSSGGALLRVDPQTGRQRTVASGGSLATPLGVVQDRGRTFVADADSFGGGGGIIAIGPSGGQRVVSRDPGLGDHPQGIAVRPDGSLLLSDLNRGAVMSVDPATGGQTRLAGAPLKYPRQMAVEPSGSILVVDTSTQGLHRIDPRRHTVTRLPVDRRLSVPFGVATVPACVPVARLSAPRGARPAGSAVRLQAGGSFDRDSRDLRFRWDLDGDGRYERSTGRRSSVSTHVPRAGRRRTVGVRVSDGGGRAAVARTTLRGSGSAPRVLAGW